MNTHLPLVSIVTPVYNGAAFLEDLITSVLAQDYPNIEHIVIDDGSTDNKATVGILERYPHVRWWSRENRGAYATMNEGMLAATGDMVTLINSDDTYASPTAISHVVAQWQSHTEWEAVYGDTIDVNAELKQTMPHFPLHPHPNWHMRYFLFCHHCALFVSTELIKRENILLDTALTRGADRDWMIRIFSPTRKVGCVCEPIALYRRHAEARSVKGGAVPDEEIIDTRYKISSFLRWYFKTVIRTRFRFAISKQQYQQGGWKLVFQSLIELSRTLIRRNLFFTGSK